MFGRAETEDILTNVNSECSDIILLLYYLYIGVFEFVE